MYKKLYAKYNKRSEQIEFIFLMNNDNEALYNYALSEIKAKESNRYYDENDYKLMCLGVIEANGNEAGIKYEFEKDFPIVFNEIPDYCKPKYNTDSITDATVRDESLKQQIINKAKGDKHGE